MMNLIPIQYFQLCMLDPLIVSALLCPSYVHNYPLNLQVIRQKKKKRHIHKTKLS